MHHYEHRSIGAPSWNKNRPIIELRTLLDNSLILPAGSIVTLVRPGYPDMEWRRVEEVTHCPSCGQPV